MLEMLRSGGFTMVPLALCSLIGWAVIFERFWVLKRLGERLREFQLEASNALLRGDWDGLRLLCRERAEVPTARIVLGALDRIQGKDARVQETWRESMERARLLANQEIRQYLWILGTIASASPFIGLAGTVVGILRAFREMAEKGAGGFAVVAAGISEALVATAAGIVVAVVALIAYNAFQVRVGKLVLVFKMQCDEMAELLGKLTPGSHRGA